VPVGPIDPGDSAGPTDPGDSADPTELEDSDARLARAGAELAALVTAAVPAWVVRCVDRALPTATPDRSTVMAGAGDAGRRAADDVGARLRALLGADVDAQHTTPLAVVRAAVSYPTEVLLAAGAAPVARDAFARERFPADLYGLAPASLAGLDPTLAEPALVWGAAKAFAHQRRHRGAGGPGAAP